MKKPGFLKSVLLAAACAFGLSSCGQQESDKDGPDKPVVALVMKSLANEFFKTMADGAEAYQKEHADQFDLIVNGIRNETDLTAQVNLVEQMVSRGVDAIVIAPADSKALAPALKRAIDAGVTVVNIDNQLDEKVLAEAGLQIPFVGPDNREGAKMVGEVVAGQLAKGDKVAIIEGVPTAFNAIQRKLGFEDAMKAAGIEVVSSQSGSWEMAKANTVAAAILSEHPEVKALLCANDSMALGAVQAVKAAGQTGKVLVAGFDNISAVGPLVQSGEIAATADQHGDELAIFGIEAALQILSGGAAENQKTRVDLIVKK
ncbi:MAG: sugar ABC transporter substrate-binding protein [Verrucomicrobiales bacterium]|nr:sugar ABC transporter substrate-binding protein [Verrucomicrobiales bacterium]